NRSRKENRSRNGNHRLFPPRSRKAELSRAHLYSNLPSRCAPLPSPTHPLNRTNRILPLQRRALKIALTITNSLIGHQIAVRGEAGGVAVHRRRSRNRIGLTDNLPRPAR